MPATPQQVSYTDDDLNSGGGYSHIAVPGWYEAELKDVEDHLSAAGNQGWKWTLDVLGADFRQYTVFSKKARWKLVSVVQAFDPTYFEEGGEVAEIDPNVFIGMKINVFIDWQTDPEELVDGEANFREIKQLESLELAENDGVEVAPI